MQSIFQIYISDTNAIPDKIMNCMRTINKHKGNYEHKILIGNDVREFILSNFSNRVLSAYDMVLPYAYKHTLHVCVFCINSVVGTLIRH